MRIHVLGLAGLMISVLVHAATQNRGPAAPFRIDDLAFMSGDWQESSGSSQVDEHWTGVAGGSMMGMSRTVSGGRTVGFEYLRIESRTDGIYYVAHPRA